MSKWSEFGVCMRITTRCIRRESGFTHGTGEPIVGMLDLDTFCLVFTVLNSVLVYCQGSAIPAVAELLFFALSNRQCVSVDVSLGGGGIFGQQQQQQQSGGLSSGRFSFAAAAAGNKAPAFGAAAAVVTTATGNHLMLY